MKESSLATLIQKRWYASRPALWLLPFSALFASLVALRRLAYRQGWLASHRVDRPVLVVGNISVGGNGKTPLILALVERARMLGIKPGVVSRGYGGKAARYPLHVDPKTPARQAGDEPVLIAARARVPVVVAPD